MKAFSIGSALALGCLALFAAPALAERITVSCTGTVTFNGAALCDQMGVHNFTADGPEVPMFVRVTAPSTHCSKVSYVLFRDDRDEQLGFTGPLGPGETQNVQVGAGWAAGANRVRVGAIGHVGGCNQGTLQSWAVDIAAAPVP